MTFFRKLLALAGLVALAALSLAARAQELAPWPAGAIPRTLPDSIRYWQTEGVRHVDTPLGLRADETALRLAQRLRDPRTLSICWRQLGDRYPNYDPAARRCYEAALAAARPISWHEGIGDALMALGMVAYDNNDHRRSLRDYDQAAQHYALVPATAASRAERLRNLLLLRANQINSHQALLDAPMVARLGRQALALYRQALASAPTPAWRIAFAERNATVTGNILTILSDHYLERRQYDSARYCAEWGLRLRPDSETVVALYLDLADLELRLGRPLAAQVHVQPAVRLARADGHLVMLREALFLQANILAALGRPAAYDSLQAYVAYNEHLTDQSRLEAAAQAQARFDSREQQAQIRALQQDRRLAAQTQELTRLLARQQVAGVSAAATLLLLGGGLLFVRYRRRQAAARAAANTALRTRLAADLHDDVGNLLTQVGMHSSLLRETPHTPAQTLARLDALAAVSRQAAQQMSDVVWGLGTEHRSLHQLLDRMRDHAQEVLPPAGLDVAFRVPPDLPDPELAPALLHNVYLIFKESLHNVVKHAQATTITVKLTAAATGLVLTVTDNGRGHDGQPRPGGHGLTNMQARAQAVGGTVRYEPRPAGFAVVAVVPLP